VDKNINPKRIPAESEISAEQRLELDRRIEEYQNNPRGNISWDEIKAEALARDKGIK
jgi:putative addiction module component (TIGR02574 family)